MTIPDNKSLREFGIALSIITGLLFGLLLPLFSSSSWPYWPWLIALSIFLIANFAPRGVLPFHITLTLVGNIIGPIVNFMILAFVFLFMITPIALFQRLFGRDTLKKKFDSKIHSYLNRTEPRDSNHMDNPY